jgi:hypothetical protein
MEQHMNVDWTKPIGDCELQEIVDALKARTHCCVLAYAERGKPPIASTYGHHHEILGLVEFAGVFARNRAEDAYGFLPQDDDELEDEQ